MKLRILVLLCSLLQILGFVIIVLNGRQLSGFMPVLLGISGFAAVVKFLLPDETSDLEKTLRPFAAAMGIVMIIFACSLI